MSFTIFPSYFKSKKEEEHKNHKEQELTSINIRTDDAANTALLTGNDKEAHEIRDEAQQLLAKAKITAKNIEREASEDAAKIKNETLHKIHQIQQNLPVKLVGKVNPLLSAIKSQPFCHDCAIQCLTETGQFTYISFPSNLFITSSWFCTQINNQKETESKSISEINIGKLKTVSLTHLDPDSKFIPVTNKMMEFLLDVLCENIQCRETTIEELMQLHFLSDFLGLKEISQEAISWLKQSCLGNPQKMLHLSTMFAKLLGSKKVYPELTDLIITLWHRDYYYRNANETEIITPDQYSDWTLLLEDKVKLGCPEAMLLLGKRYLLIFESKDAHKNIGKGLELIEALANDKENKSKSNIWARFSLGMHYWNNKDLTEAHAWFLTAAEQGLPEAQMMVSRYLENSGEEGSLDWLVKAAEQGEPEAQMRLGMLLKSKPPYSNEEAEKWLKKAAAEGFPDARYLLEHLEK